MPGRVVALVLSLAMSVAGLACSPASGCGERTDGCLRVLFVGNSYTQVNDLPSTFAALARAGGHRLEVGMAAEGGQTLAGHTTSANTQRQLVAGQWDVVVLQEQSEIPSVAWSRDNEMAPGAQTLVAEIRGIGARPVFFSTWAHRDGWPENGMDEATMEAGIDQSYLSLGQQLGVGVAPVGEAWTAAAASVHGIGLWQADGSHPTAAGTFLAAAVFYAALFTDDPVAASKASGAPSVDGGEQLAGIARDVVADRRHWGLQ